MVIMILTMVFKLSSDFEIKQNLAVQMDLICNVKSNGAGFTNGGIEIEISCHLK
jgi:hypothetical protein